MSEFRPRKAYVVSHTHWDREWYLTYSTFRVNLAHAVRRVLDALENEDAFEHFLLDGQAVVLEDYLEAHPEDEQRIRDLVTSGALGIGPWYMLPDEYLIGPETMVRNLVVGHATCARVGAAQSVGYMADSFGHPAQIPQLLREAGIDSFVYTRGNGSELEETGHEYLWEAPDGSTVLAIQQCGGYCNAAGLGHEEIWHAHTRRNVSIDGAVEKVGKLFDTMGRLSNGDVVLLNNGCDHFPPQRELGPILSALRESYPDTEFVHSSLAEYVAEVREKGIATKRFRGELCQGRYFHILSGVWSARMPLKQRNARSQALLSGIVEPLATYTHFVHGRDLQKGLFDHAWRELLKNQPHDSICGCSIDEVHRDMAPRFDAVDQTMEQVLVRELEHLAPTFAREAKDDRDTVLCVANPLPRRRTEVLERLVVLQPLGVDPADLRLVDEDGCEVPCVVTRSDYVERFWGIDYRVMFDTDAQRAKFYGYLDAFKDRFVRRPGQREDSDCFLDLQFVARDLPALGHRNYRLTDRAPTETAKPPVDRVTVDGSTLRNAEVRVTLHPDGTLDVVQLATGRRWRGLNVLEDVEDIGDEYDYSPAPESLTVRSQGLAGEIRVVGETDFRATLQAEFEIELPRAIHEGRRRRTKDRVACPVTVSVCLTAGSPLIDVTVSFENDVEDHRLRAIFPDLADATTVISDGHFHVIERPIERPSDDDFVQPHPETFPQLDFSLVQDAGGGLALLNQGLPEIEPIAGLDGRLGLGLTLLRSVGWLSRDDFPTRRSQNAGPTIPTPEAQCLGAHTFRYALLPFSGDWLTAGVKGVSQRWRLPPAIIQGVEDLEQPGTGDFVRVRDDQVCVSAVKRHEGRDTLIVRLFNLGPEAREATVEVGPAVEAAWRTDLLERRGDPLSVADETSVTVPLRPHGIATVEIALR